MALCIERLPRPSAAHASSDCRGCGSVLIAEEHDIAATALGEAPMAEELTFPAGAAAAYDLAFAHVTRYFMPLVLRAAQQGRAAGAL